MAARVLVSHTARRAHRSIASALQAVASSRRPVRVEIEPGRYEESLTVRGDVELAATGGSVVISSAHGSVIDAWGTVRLTGLSIVGSDGDAVRCGAGTLTVEGSQIQGIGGVGLHAVPGTSVTVRDSAFRNGRAVFAGSTGLVERCRFADSATNAVAAIEGADVRIHDCWIGHARIHGVLVSGSRALVSGCELTGTGNASLAADKQAELVVRNCRVTAVHSTGVWFAEQSRGLLEDTVVSDAEHGVAVAHGANPVVRRCTFTNCRDTGINVHTQGLGRFEDCQVTGAGNVAVFSTTGGSPDIDGCRISNGNVGIAVVNGRGRFARCEISDLTNAALRLWEDSSAQFSGIQVARCPVGLDARGGGGTKAELVDTHFRTFSQTAVAVLEQARITLRNCTAEHGLVGLGVGDQAQLLAYDCRLGHLEAGGAIVYDKATFTAERLTVTHPGAYGLRGQDSAYLSVQDSEFADTRYVGVSVGDSCGGRLVNCLVTGSQGASVVDNDRIQLIGLRSSLPVTKEAPKPPPDLPSRIINIFNGAVFNATVHGVQLAWDNETVSQHQNVRPPEETAMSERPKKSSDDLVSNTYNGPVFNAEVKNSQLAWNNTTINQNQTHTEQIAPGFEEVARVVADVLARLDSLGLPESDARDATEQGSIILTEVVRPEPDRGVIRRGLTALKGVLAQLAAGLLTGANAGAIEAGKQLIGSLGHLDF
jgi:nitrous oxidase accessory protein NosD